MILRLSQNNNLRLDTENLIVKRSGKDMTQILVRDLAYTSVMANTSELLGYLESLTEEVRQVSLEQKSVRI